MIIPASVVIIVYSSLPERVSTWFITATMSPTAAILKMMSMLNFLPPYSVFFTAIL